MDQTSNTDHLRTNFSSEHFGEYQQVYSSTSSRDMSSDSFSVTTGKVCLCARRAQNRVETRCVKRRSAEFGHQHHHHQINSGALGPHRRNTSSSSSCETGHALRSTTSTTTTTTTSDFYGIINILGHCLRPGCRQLRNIFGTYSVYNWCIFILFVLLVSVSRSPCSALAINSPPERVSMNNHNDNIIWGDWQRVNHVNS